MLYEFVCGWKGGEEGRVGGLLLWWLLLVKEEEEDVELWCEWVWLPLEEGWLMGWV